MSFDHAAFLKDLEPLMVKYNLTGIAGLAFTDSENTTTFKYYSPFDKQAKEGANAAYDLLDLILKRGGSVVVATNEFISGLEGS